LLLLYYVATAGVVTVSLHDALQISRSQTGSGGSNAIELRPLVSPPDSIGREGVRDMHNVSFRFKLIPAFKRIYILLYFCLQFFQDRKSTRLNSSHLKISYAVFCLKK